MLKKSAVLQTNLSKRNANLYYNYRSSPLITQETYGNTVLLNTCRLGLWSSGVAEFDLQNKLETNVVRKVMNPKVVVAK